MLSAGTRIGPYEVIAPLGAGGMGEVYRTRDTRLKRDVALKVLPQSVAHDPDRLARFQREAEALAALQHPSIAAIYGLEHVEGTLAIAMELVEGETLADRIARGSIPFDETRPVAAQIADALEAAHEKGIVHRDLKPANIKLTANGGVKLLDFGLAKLAVAGDGSSALVSGMATVTSPALITGAAVILGTAAYMSPEQARGRQVDKRTDVWAFGCVLFEILSGQRAFDGEDVTETLGAVIHKEPDWSRLPALPPAVSALLRACLQKDPRRRLRDIGDARLALEGAFDTDVASAPALRARRSVWWRLAPLFAAMLITAALTSAIWWATHSEADIAVARFTIALPVGQQFAAGGGNIVAVSPDGKKVAYATSGGTSSRLWVRPIADTSARQIAEETVQPTVGALTFTSDSESIIYWAGTGPQNGTFKRVDIGGGTAVPLLSASFPAGASVSGDTLVFATLDGEILQVPVSGGPAQRVLDVGRGVPWSPQLLPGGKTVLYTVARNIASTAGATTVDWDQADIVVQDLNSNTSRPLLKGTGARYLASGHIAYAIGGNLFVQPFDAKRLEVRDKPIPVVAGIRRPVFFNASPGTVYFDASTNGVLVYLTGPADVGAIRAGVAVLTRDGKSTPLDIQPNIYRSIRLSPDERYVLVDVGDAANSQLWLYELSGATSMRQLTVTGRNGWGIWSPDGQVAFQSDREGPASIYVQPADNSRGAERLTTAAAGEAHRPLSWRNGQLLYEVTKNGERSLRVMSVAERKATLFGNIRSTSQMPISAEFSPDGGWVAYSAAASDPNVGRLVVEPFPPTGSIHPIAEQAYNPVWSRDGRELLYQRRGQIQVARIVPGSGFAFRDAAVIQRGQLMPFRAAVGRQLDLRRDGQIVGVVATGPDPGTPGSELNVVLGWFNELKTLTIAR